MQTLTYPSSRVAQAMLRWHYRSRHESLITFSNGQFYDYGLITFPSSGKSPHPLGIRFEFVPDGVYDRGRTRTNRREAERVAALILEHFRRWPERTLGVVAFSEPQREAISQALERLVDRHPEFEVHLEGDRLHGFFVKNLENVQGDERDVMIFSVGYGRDSAGDMAMNFGPLTLGASFHDPANRPRLAELLRQVVRVEGPIHRDLVASRVASACSIARRGHRVESAINRALGFGASRGWFKRVGAYVYAAEMTRAGKVRAPKRGDDATRREGTHIPPDEIQLAAELVLSRAGRLERERLLVRLARIFGFDRLGGNILAHFEEAFLAGTREGRLVVDDSDWVSLPDRPAEGPPQS